MSRTLEFDLETRSVTSDNKSVRLTGSEFIILYTLYHCMGNIAPREEMLREMNGDLINKKTRSLDVHISSLRKKIAGLGPFYIRSVYGKGYMLSTLKGDF